MENTDYILDLMKIILPALLVLAAAALVWKKAASGSPKEQGQTLPLRLQAYERLVLLVERISPSSLLVRNHQPGMSARELNAILIAEIRAEFEHNITQQLYVSERSWQMTRSLKDKTISMINGIARSLPEEAAGMELTRAVLNHVSSLETDPYQQALTLLREEVKAFF